MAQMLGLLLLPTQDENLLWQTYESEVSRKEAETQERRRETVRKLQEEEDNGVWICEYPEIVQLANTIRDLKKLGTDAAYVSIAHGLRAVKRIRDQLEEVNRVPRNRYLPYETRYQDPTGSERVEDPDLSEG